MAAVVCEMRKGVLFEERREAEAKWEWRVVGDEVLAKSLMGHEDLLIHSLMPAFFLGAVGSHSIARNRE